jgi:hypothetical protein
MAPGMILLLKFFFTFVTKSRDSFIFWGLNYILFFIGTKKLEYQRMHFFLLCTSLPRVSARKFIYLMLYRRTRDTDVALSNCPFTNMRDNTRLCRFSLLIYIYRNL